MNIKELDKFATHIANLCWAASKEDKETIRDGILLHVFFSCQEYEQNEAFKKELEHLIKSNKKS